ncbi:AraC family transcriptional regulator [Saccharobesus litoralis]|uniref:AraC family transcriptional regulator n=1 Tax=Saccharobesus litoralis TaxID=2172099 RepID=A0A2S0VM66_9ALTE|nr:helix-turn-helix domain-containing protein [Saccharobesus litoralis]AWB65293.1 AraC family transcriptional regulator [Saccharobesus litoralis]
MNGITSIQNEFVESVGFSQVLDMYNLLPDVMFWVKDIHHRFIFANKVFLDRNGLDNIEQIVGRVGHDVLPNSYEQLLNYDDDIVLNNKQNVDRIEKEPISQSQWLMMSKRPIYNHKSEVIGTYGIGRQVDEPQPSMSGTHSMKEAVDYIKSNFKQAITIEELADLVHLSASAFQRRFKKVVKKTPWQLLTEVRMTNAKALIESTDLSIAQVAFECGFSDHSYFSKQFKAYSGELPTQYRLHHQKALM